MLKMRKIRITATFGTSQGEKHDISEILETPVDYTIFRVTEVVGKQWAERCGGTKDAPIAIKVEEVEW